MRTRSKNPFTTITTSGLLLPVDLLTRIVEGDPDLKGLSPKDYHLRIGERLNEAASRAWNECLAAWKSFRKKFAALPASDAGTTLTRDEWLLPLFQELGYGRLQNKKAIEIDGKEYPVSHGWENHVPIHLLSARLPLDRRTPGTSGAATRAPYSLLQELINRSGQHRWGFVTNGLKLFLLRDNAALARAANVEFDLEAMMDGELYADFMLLFLVCHQSRLEIQGDQGSGGGDQGSGGKPEDCWLEKWANLADKQGTRAKEKLRDGVEAAIKSLGAGFLRPGLRPVRSLTPDPRSLTPDPSSLRQRLATGELSTQDYYRQLLRLVYRILLLLVAEEKKTETGENLLHKPGTSPEVRDRYARFYSVSRIRTLAYARRGTAHTDLYESLKVLFHKLRSGYEPLGIPGMGSFLFSDDSTPDLDHAALANQDLLDAFRNLCYTEDVSGRGGGIRRPVDFGNLGSEELGSVYESLLELHPLIDTDEGPFTLGTAAGHERKTTGSYYTPTSLINCLLDSALDPVVEDRLEEAGRVASGEWRTVEEQRKALVVVLGESLVRTHWKSGDRDGSRELPGLGRVPARHDAGRDGIQTDEVVSQGRTLRDDESDPKGSQFDSGKHRRRVGETGDEGISTIPSDSTGQSPGTGNALAAESKGRYHLKRTDSTIDDRSDDTQQATGGSSKKSGSSSRLTNRDLSGQNSQLTTRFFQTPLATRHSLLAEQALLAMKVCDPACGSGHFLIAAAERMAMHLARLRTGDDQPSTLDVQHAKRDIIGRCIYGVDLNPMAVELCKVSLWMEALEPGKPLSFLDHHIQCGNSLLGTTPKLLADGIPDDAFKPIEGDDNTVCSELKKDNKQERKDYEAGYRDFHFTYDLGNLPAEFAKLTGSTDESVADAETKAHRYAELVKGAAYQNARLLADAWCAAFVWKKDKSALGKLCPTERGFRNLQSSPHGALPQVKTEVGRLHDQYQFFHWHLAFPDVFRLPTEVEASENEQCGWHGGFGVVLGNPPWERIKIQEKEWFSERRPDIANAQNAASRRRMIKALSDVDPCLLQEFQQDQRRAEGDSHFVRDSGRYPLCGRGDVNTYQLFAESNWRIVAPSGRVGCIVPCGIATDNTTKHFFREVLHQHSLAAVFGFINEEMLFPAVLHNFKFCLLVLSGINATISNPDIVFNCYNIQHLADESRHFTVSPDDVELLNPNTGTCPVFFWRRSAEITKAVYRRVPILHRENEKNEWDVTFYTMFHMSGDSRYFRTARFDDALPLLEAKMMHQYNHRFASYAHLAEGERSHMLPESETARLADPRFSTEPCYFVPRTEVNRRLEGRFPYNWLVGYREITSAGLQRTTIYSVLPLAGVNHKIPLVSLGTDSKRLVQCFVGCMNSFSLDFLARQKLGGASFSFFLTRQLPVIPPGAYSERCSWSVDSTTCDWIDPRVLELTYTAWDLEPFAVDCGYEGPPFRWDEERRFLLRCELDAAYFHLYLGSEEEWGADNPTLREMFPTPRDAVDYVMDTFPIVRRKDEAKYAGDYRTKRVILEIYDAMADVMRTNRERRVANGGKELDHSQLATYHSPLVPPPGPPTDPEGNFIPFSQWTPDLDTSHIHPEREFALRRENVIRDIMLLLHEWNAAVSISALELGVLFMQHDKLRERMRTLAGGGRSVAKSETTTDASEPTHLIADFDVLYAEMIGGGLIEAVGETGYRINDATLVGQLSESQFQRAREAIEVVANFDQPEEVVRVLEKEHAPIALQV